MEMATSSNKKGSEAAQSPAAKLQAYGAESPLGRPLDLDTNLIEEDPHQPRTRDNPGFSPTCLSELAATIRLRGVKTPISVREHPDTPGRYIINHGARRLRASKLAGRATIPGFIDNDYNDADQVIENLQRNELTAREIADYIGRELAKGSKKIDIAKSIGKSAAFVTQHVTLLDLPAPIATAFTSGRTKDVTVINELVTSFKKKPEEVTAWLEDQTQEVTRSSVKLLREFLDEKQSREESASYEESDDQDNHTALAGTDDSATETKKSESGTGEIAQRMKSPIVQVLYDKRPALLVLHRRPSMDGRAWVKCEDDGQELEVELTQVRLVAIVER
jgi:ParB family chromosome partitioning protein